MSEVEVFLPHMRGSCVTVQGKVHGLFKLGSSAGATSPEHRLGSLLAEHAHPSHPVSEPAGA